MRRDRIAANAQDVGGGFGRLVPAAVDEEQARAVRQRVVAVQLEPVLLDEGDCGVQVPTGHVVAAPVDCGTDERRVHDAHVRGVSSRLRELECFLHRHGVALVEHPGADTLRAWIALRVSPSLCASASPFPAQAIASSCHPAVPQWLPSTV